MFEGTQLRAEVVLHEIQQHRRVRTKRCVVWLGPQELSTKYKNEIRNCSVETASSAGCADASQGCQMDAKLHMLIAHKCVFKSSDTLPKPKSGKPQKSLTPACSGCSLCSSHVLADTMYESKPLEVLTANHLFPSHFPMDCEQTHSSQIAQNLNF